MISWTHTCCCVCSVFPFFMNNFCFEHMFLKAGHLLCLQEYYTLLTTYRLSCCSLEIGIWITNSIVVFTVISSEYCIHSRAAKLCGLIWQYDFLRLPCIYHIYVNWVVHKGTTVFQRQLFKPLWIYHLDLIRCVITSPCSGVMCLFICILH